MIKDLGHSSPGQEKAASARLLSALVNGKLSEQEQRVLLARVHESPDDAARVTYYRAQNEALQALFPCRPPRRSCSCSAV